MASSLQNPLAQDLDDVLEYAKDCFEELKGTRLFITGGTGFFGRWLLESLSWANSKLHTDIRAVVLSRDTTRFRQNCPLLAGDKHFELLPGDIRDFGYPSGTFDYVVHAATQSSAALNASQPRLMFDTIVEGTNRALDFAVKAGSEGFLLTSSGAVYGPQPSDITHVTEEFRGGPDQVAVSSAYAEGKRAAEFLTANAHHEFGLPVRIARGFAFVGPHLPLDVHFAIGNFIRDGLSGGPIKISGDGTPHRSYLYASDLAIWLLTVLVKGEAARAYNVGSEDSLSIKEIAGLVSQQLAPPPPIVVAGKPDPNAPISRYVPSTQRAQKELGLQQRVPLATAIAKTIAWHQSKG